MNKEPSRTKTQNTTLRGFILLVPGLIIKGVVTIHTERGVLTLV